MQRALPARGKVVAASIRNVRLGSVSSLPLLCTYNGPLI